MKKNKDNQTHKIRTALACVGVMAALLLFCSCWSFAIGDVPSPYVYPPNEPPANWCGPTGAFCAFYLLYYIGQGVFVLLPTAAYFFIAMLRGQTVTQPVLRSIGLGLLSAAFSASFYLLWPHTTNAFPMGNGGILGIAAGSFLRSHFALLGTAFIVAGAWVVGAILLADTFVLAMLRGLGEAIARIFGVAAPAWSAARQSSGALGEIWQKLSARQKQLAAEAKEQSGVVEAITVEEPVAVIDEHADSSLEQLADTGEAKENENADDAQAEPVADDAQKKMAIRLTMPQIRKPAQPYVPKTYDDYTLPPMSLLAEPEYGFASVQEKVVKSKAAMLEKLLSEFNVSVRIVAAETGPVITMFELELAPGIKVSQIVNLSNDMARALGAQAIRVVHPLQGKHTIGIEVPNSEKEKVRIKDLFQIAGNRHEKMNIPLFLGKDSSGEALVADLTAMPHVLIAGTTGSGKSVCINSIITSILLTKRPDEVKLIMVDPKMVEMAAFNNIPHLMCPIVTETKQAEQILEWATVKMDERYALLAEAGVKNVAGYNKLSVEELVERFKPGSPEEEAKLPKKLPYIVIIVDELADLMMTSGKEIESFIVRLAQKSRAIGIHIVLATQRPQATVVTGLIKSNMPCRISFRVAARMDSRIVLDQNGAEALLGQGDMLFLQPGTSELIRAQGAFLDDNEVRGIVKHLAEVAEPQYHPELMQLNKIDPADMPRDEMFDEAVRLVLESHRGSVSLLQRKLSIGYARASRIIELMAAAGILGEYKGSQAREVLMTLKEYESLRAQMERDAAAGFADLADDDSSAKDSGDTGLGQGPYEYIASQKDDEA
ncbi:MAG: DNA translocase FtsK 4TM domain-containing protein [Sedimentisphaerales bacterium]|nr:DNA translocase FtsK 4TM domain-containing protein [Sedimentisphaerales bacterium]